MNGRDAFITVADGLKLHYRDYDGAADKAPLLCLHGLTRNERDFAEFAARYAPGRRVIALDFRGRGGSDYDPQPMRYLPLTYAGDVIELLDQLGIPQAVFVGTSLGGLVTMLLAVMAPQRILASILNDVGPQLNEGGLDRIRTYVGKQMRFATWDDAAALLADYNKHIPASFSNEDWVAAARRLCSEKDGEVVFDYDPAIAVPFEAVGPTPQVDMWPLFTALGQKPLLVFRGELSDVLSAEALGKMQAAVPTMRGVTVAGVGHAPMLDEADAVPAIDAFLAALPG